MPFFQTTIFRTTVDHGWLTLHDTISVNGVLYPINSKYSHTRLMDLTPPYMMIKDNDSILKVFFRGDTIRFEIE